MVKMHRAYSTLDKIDKIVLKVPKECVSTKFGIMNHWYFGFLYLVKNHFANTPALFCKEPKVRFFGDKKPEDNTWVFEPRIKTRFRMKVTF